MAARQLLVCPYSSVHTDETRLWRHDYQEDLYKFIKQTARGHQFNQAYKIKQTQIHRSFEAFISDGSLTQDTEISDTFRDEIHRWNGYFWIDINLLLGDLEAMRQGKVAAAEELVKLFPGWSKLTTSFQEDVDIEAKGYGKSLLDQYLQMVVNLGTGKFMDYMDAPMDTIYVESLLHYDSSSMDIESRLTRIGEYFSSEYFAHTPNVNISCSLFAVLRKKVKNGAYTNQKKAQKKLSGLFYDSEWISVFGPYCDGIFIDKEMKQWCDDPEAKLFTQSNTKTFSVAGWQEFHQYLDEVENNYTDDIHEALNWIYPGVYA